MSQTPERVAIVGGLRLPFVKSFTQYQDESNMTMLTFVLSALVEKFHLKGERLGEVALGAVMMHSSDWNLTREVVLGSGLAPETPGFNVQRACGTSLDTVNLIGLKIASRQISIGIAGGSDTNSDLPVVLKKSFAKKLVSLGRARSTSERFAILSSLRPGDLKFVFPGVAEPRTGLSMGEHTEAMAKRWKISRSSQDELAFRSHQNAARAYRDGFYEDLVLEFNGLKRDAIVREDTTLEKLAKLKPAFDRGPEGTLTAGNSTPLTDGAAAVLLASETEAKRRNLPVLAFLRDVESAAVNYVNGEEGLLMAPAYAVARLLKRNNLKLQDFDVYEIHEAFEAQVLATLSAWESDDFCRSRLGENHALGKIDQSRMNIHGGSVALGHPFAATGARIIATLAKELHRRGNGRALVSICTAGGMGVAAIIEKA